MKKKYGFITVLVILSFQPTHTIAQNWFPSEVGNVWQYKDSYWYENPYYGSLNISLQHYYINGETFIGNTRYFKFSSYDQRWLTFNESDQKLYVLNSDSNCVYMDFNVPQDSVFNAFHPEVGFCQLTSKTRTFNWLDSTIIARGLYYQEGDLNYYEKIWEYFVPNIGYQYYSFWHRNWPDYHKERTGYLLEAIVDGIYFSEGYNPEITIGQFSINYPEVYIELYANHEYNELFYYEFESFVYIGSVKMNSFYSKEDSVINNPVFYIDYANISNVWTSEYYLDANLLDDGFTFNYQFEAIDRGLIPRHGFTPDSGYYKYSITGVSDDGKTLSKYELSQNFPNPFNPSTKIKFEIANSGFTTLKIYDILGKEITTLVNEVKPSGSYEIEFNGSGLPSGLYFYKLQAGDFLQTKKMIMLK